MARRGRDRTMARVQWFDRFGYAILPSLSPYRVNNVTLDTRKMRSDAGRREEISGCALCPAPSRVSISPLSAASSADLSSEDAGWRHTANGR